MGLYQWLYTSRPCYTDWVQSESKLEDYRLNLPLLFLSHSEALTLNCLTKELMSVKNSSMVYFLGSKAKYLEISVKSCVIFFAIPSRTVCCSLDVFRNSWQASQGRNSLRIGGLTPVYYWIRIWGFTPVYYWPHYVPAYTENTCLPFLYKPYHKLITSVGLCSRYCQQYSGPSLKGPSLERIHIYEGHKFLAASTVNACGSTSHQRTPLW